MQRQKEVFGGNTVAGNGKASSRKDDMTLRRLPSHDSDRSSANFMLSQKIKNLYDKFYRLRRFYVIDNALIYMSKIKNIILLLLRLFNFLRKISS